MDVRPPQSKVISWVFFAAEVAALASWIFELEVIEGIVLGPASCVLVTVAVAGGFVACNWPYINSRRHSTRFGVLANSINAEVSDTWHKDNTYLSRSAGEKAASRGALKAALAELGISSPDVKDDAGWSTYAPDLYSYATIKKSSGARKKWPLSREE